MPALLQPGFKSVSHILECSTGDLLSAASHALQEECRRRVVLAKRCTVSEPTHVLPCPLPPNPPCVHADGEDDPSSSDDDSALLRASGYSSGGVGSGGVGGGAGGGAGVPGTPGGTGSPGVRHFVDHGGAGTVHTTLMTGAGAGVVDDADDFL